VNDDRPDVWTLYEVWSDHESEAAYRAFRATPEGAEPRLGEFSAAPPTVESFVIRG